MYCPAAHEATTHGPPPGPMNPVLQTQEPTLERAVSVCPEFDGQGLHDASPAVGLYVCMGHSAHVPPPSGPVYPGRHLQATILVAALKIAYEFK
jgi:hypothetical protein